MVPIAMATVWQHYSSEKCDRFALPIWKLQLLRPLVDRKREISGTCTHIKIKNGIIKAKRHVWQLKYWNRLTTLSLAQIHWWLTVKDPPWSILKPLSYQSYALHFWLLRHRQFLHIQPRACNKIGTVASLRRHKCAINAKNPSKAPNSRRKLKHQFTTNT